MLAVVAWRAAVALILLLLLWRRSVVAGALIVGRVRWRRVTGLELMVSRQFTQKRLNRYEIPRPTCCGGYAPC